MDIENFFDSVSEVVVYKMFRNLGYKPLLSFELSRICTIESEFVNKAMAGKWVNYNTGSDVLLYQRKNVKYFGRLPQGALTRPAISNIIFRDIDEELQSFSEKNNLTYIRYADDICFSSHNKAFTRDCAKLVIDFCSVVLRTNGYEAKKLETKIIPPGVRKVVLGFNIGHDEPKLTKAYKKNRKAISEASKSSMLLTMQSIKNLNLFFGMLGTCSWIN